MKLNNKGWSLQTMVGFVCVLILFLLIVAFLSWRFGIEETSPAPLIDEELIFFKRKFLD